MGMIPVRMQGGGTQTLVTRKQSHFKANVTLPSKLQVPTTREGRLNEPNYLGTTRCPAGTADGMQ